MCVCSIACLILLTVSALGYSLLGVTGEGEAGSGETSSSGWGGVEQHGELTREERVGGTERKRVSVLYCVYCIRKT